MVVHRFRILAVCASNPRRASASAVDHPPDRAAQRVPTTADEECRSQGLRDWVGWSGDAGRGGCVERERTRGRIQCAKRMATSAAAPLSIIHQIDDIVVKSEKALEFKQKQETSNAKFSERFECLRLHQSSP